MVAEGGRRVGGHFPSVLLPWILLRPNIGAASIQNRTHVTVNTFVGARTRKADKLVAPFVHNQCAHLALKALLVQAPDEVFAVGTEGGLFEEAWNEFVQS